MMERGFKLHPHMKLKIHESRCAAPGLEPVAAPSPPFIMKVTESAAPVASAAGFRPFAGLRRNRAAGSTLVEMVVTVGLVVSVMLPLVGMLTMGMETSLKAGVNTIGSRITNHLLGEMQQARWKDLDNWGRDTLYFNDQGHLVKDGENSTEVAFVAKVHISPPGLTLTTGNAPVSNGMQRKVTTLISPAGVRHGERLLTEALTALEQGKPTPASVRVGHGLIINTGKDA